MWQWESSSHLSVRNAIVERLTDCTISLTTPLVGSVSWRMSPCVGLSSGDRTVFRCVILISINRLVLGHLNSPPLTSSAVWSTRMKHTILFRTETSSTSCGISTSFVWGRFLGIPSFIPAISFARVRFEAEVATNVYNGAIRTVNYVSAQLAIFQWDAAAPTSSFFGTFQPSI